MKRGQKRVCFQPVVSWLVLVILASLLAACGGKQQTAVSLAYSSEADELVIFADENTSPGGFAIGQECNHIPRLRIWGDGRTIYADIQEGHRRVLVGQTSPETISAILQKLTDLQYFTKPPESTFSGAGTGYRIGIHLQEGDHESFWSQPNEIYPALIDAFDPAALTDFVPEEGYLVVGPRLRKDIFTDPLAWPDNFGFRLSDADASGRTVSGETLEFLWQAINRQPEPLTGILDGESIYAVAVFVEGISIGEPPFKCWNK